MWEIFLPAEKRLDFPEGLFFSMSLVYSPQKIQQDATN
jgi:hypothetical protein